MKNIFLAVFVISLLSGCSFKVADLGIVSTNRMNIETSKYRIDTTQKIIGRDSTSTIFVIPSRFRKWPSIDQAVENALIKSPGAVGISNVKVSFMDYYFPFIYGQTKYTVEGYPIFPNKE
jgi:hypothetical protein